MVRVASRFLASLVLLAFAIGVTGMAGAQSDKPAPASAPTTNNSSLDTTSPNAATTGSPAQPAIRSSATPRKSRRNSRRGL
jgi:hypothetical protein